VAPGNGLLNGLLVYWPLSEESGNRADLHSNGYTLTEGGTLGADTGLVYPKAAVFAAGADNYLTRALAGCALINFSAATPFTIAVWCYPTAFDTGADAPTYYRQILNMNLASPFGGGYLLQSTTTLDATHYSAYVQIGKTGGPPPFSHHTGMPLGFVANAWHLVAITHNANVFVYYMNGNTETDTNEIAFTAASGGELSIGIRSPSTPTQNYDGRLGPIAMWNRALSVAQLNAFYNAGAGMAYAQLTT